MHSIAFISRSNLRLTLFSVDPNGCSPSGHWPDSFIDSFLCSSMRLFITTAHSGHKQSTCCWKPRAASCMWLLTVVAGLAPRGHPLVGQVVKVSASRAEDPGFESHLRRDFSRSSHTSDFKIGTPVASLPGALRYSISAGTDRPGVSIL